MGTSITPELNKRNKYYIPRHRYYELKHFCLQYNDWKREVAELEKTINTKSIIFFKNKKEYSDITSKISCDIFSLERKIGIINLVISKLDDWIQPFIFEAVTQDKTFVYLKTVRDIPCERDTYYDRYRKFFWVLDGCRDV